MINKFSKYIKEISTSGADTVKLIDTTKVEVGNWVRLKLHIQP